MQQARMALPNGVYGREAGEAHAPANPAGPAFDAIIRLCQNLVATEARWRLVETKSNLLVGCDQVRRDDIFHA
jgi:hypothetical protein